MTSENNNRSLNYEFSTDKRVLKTPVLLADIPKQDLDDGRSLISIVAKATLVTAVATVVIPPLLVRATCVGIYDFFTSDELLWYTIPPQN